MFQRGAVFSIGQVRAFCQQTKRPLDKVAVKKLMLRTVDDIGGALGLHILYLGDRSKLFRALGDASRSGQGMPAPELAASLGLDVRYVEEWCLAATSHSYVEKRDDCFFLTPEQDAFFADSGSGHFKGGFAQVVHATTCQAGPLLDAMKTGGGVTYEDFGPDMAEGIAKMHAPVHDGLLGQWLEAIPEVGSPSSVLDLGCGEGHSSRALRRQFVRSNVDAVDVDASSIQAARNEVGLEGVSSSGSLTFFHSTTEQFLSERPGTVYDLAVAYDCIHDMAQPQEVLAQLRKHVRVLVWFEPHGSADPYENRTLLGARITSGLALNCVATSKAMGGVGLGALGCTAEVAERMAVEAGFSFRHETKLPGARFRNNAYVLTAEH